MPISTVLTNALRNTRAFLLGFRLGVHEFLKSGRLIWRVTRFSFHMCFRSTASSADGLTNAQRITRAFVAGFKSGSYEFWTPARLTWRFLCRGFSWLISKLDAKYLNEQPEPKYNYENMTLEQALKLGAKRGFENYFALNGVIYRWLRGRR
jgi:hypothetical protein